MKSEPATDQSLVRRLRRGNEDAATKLYLRYAHKIANVARENTAKDLAVRVDAEEIVQSVFRTFFRRASTGCYDVPQGTDLWGLLLVIALNKVRTAGKFHRAAKRDISLTIGGNAIDWSKETRVGVDDIAFIHLELVVDEVLSKMKPTYRSMLQMRIEGFDVAEIAAKSKRSKRTVERILQECRATLDATLHEDD